MALSPDVRLCERSSLNIRPRKADKRPDSPVETPKAIAPQKTK